MSIILLKCMYGKSFPLCSVLLLYCMSFSTFSEPPLCFALLFLSAPFSPCLLCLFVLFNRQTNVLWHVPIAHRHHCCQLPQKATFSLAPLPPPAHSHSDSLRKHCICHQLWLMALLIAVLGRHHTYTFCILCKCEAGEIFKILEVIKNVNAVVTSWLNSVDSITSSLLPEDD